MSDEWTEDQAQLLLAALMADGLLEVCGVNEDGESLFRLTKEGQAQAEEFIFNTVEGAQFWADLQRRGI